MTSFEIRNTKNRGKGLFSRKHFEKGQVILRFDGEFVDSKGIEDYMLKYFVDERNLQIGKDLYLDIEKDPSVFINHSCRPNCYVKIAVNNAFLIALYPIQPNEELAYDYSLTSTEKHDTWKMDCSCGHYGCRKVISGFEYLPEEQKKKLIEEGRVPKHVIAV